MAVGGASRPVRILLVDDHAVVRAGLRMVIESEASFAVVGEAANRDQALSLAQATTPDIILLDIDLGGEHATQFLKELQDIAPGARVLVLTALRDSALHREAVRLGARGVLLKDQAADSVKKAIRKVYDGELWLDQSLTQQLIASLAGPGDARQVDPHQARIGTLTQREREVIELVAAGLRNKEVAERLFISETTVRHHLTAIFAKLEVSDRLGLALYAFRHGLAALKK